MQFIKLIALTAFAVSALFFIQSCNDPVTVGAELTEQDRIPIAFLDTFQLRARTIENDVVRTFSNTSSLFSYPIGNYDDPIFGKLSSEVYTQVLPPLGGVSDFYDGTPIELDSVILTFQYDTSGFYGNWENGIGVEVYYLADELNADDTYTSDQTFAKGSLLGSRFFVPSKLDVLQSPNDSTTMNILGRLRVPLDNSLGQSFIGLDSAILSSDTLFSEFFNGLVISPIASQTDGFVAVSLVSQNSNIRFYYRETGDSISRTANFRTLGIPPVKTLSYERDISGSVLEGFVGDFNKGDSLLFIQGANGTRVQVELPDLSFLEGLRLSKAELVLTAAEIESDDLEINPRVPSISAFFDDNGEDKLIDDFVLAASSNPPNILIGGGVLFTDSNDETSTYTLNVTDHIQSVIDDPGRSKTLYLNAFFPDFYDRPINFAPLLKPERVNRSVLYGAKHSEHPIKLRIAYFTF